MPQLIQNRDVYDLFLKILPTLERDEVYFTSLSARNKYLTQDERDKYSLGRTEMFSRQVATSKDEIELAIQKMEADLTFKTTRNGHLIPEKSLVVYINIHPSSMVNAYGKFRTQMNVHSDELLASLSGGSNPHYQPFLGMRTKLLNHIQKAPSRKVWLDIDIDAPSEELAVQHSGVICEALSLASVNNIRIKTQGGVHIIVELKSLKARNIPLYRLVQDAHNALKPLGGECKFNENAMVPLPGTLQAGRLVEFLDIPYPS